MPQKLGMINFLLLALKITTSEALSVDLIRLVNLRGLNGFHAGAPESYNCATVIKNSLFNLKFILSVFTLTIYI